ncbi:hypothetical protein FA15DRAFT_657808 [Coprinopsis marcescibilis]|uniref:Uncharacterized protein n=1 Tax=Coprinopsis marcescibilis TaxID=230819 RepID=A0A5C3KP49_COPMA|nr:hypothetical protein FA15DRAFT_657808 [Coprinopsis marcescibilis]
MTEARTTQGLDRLQPYFTRTMCTVPLESPQIHPYEGPARGVYSVGATDGVVECVFVVDEWGKGTGSLGEVKEAWKGIAVSDSLPIVRVEGAVVLPGLRILIACTGVWIQRADPARGSQDYQRNREMLYITCSGARISISLLMRWNCGGSDLSSHPVLANRQITLSSKDGHATWVSQTTFDANGPYPAELDGGVIVRDAKGGVTGAFIDRRRHWSNHPRSSITPQVKHKRFTNTVCDALSFDLTSFHGFNPIPLDFFTGCVLVLVLVVVFGVGDRGYLPSGFLRFVLRRAHAGLRFFVWRFDTSLSCPILFYSVLFSAFRIANAPPPSRQSNREGDPIKDYSMSCFNISAIEARSPAASPLSSEHP